MKLWNRFFFEPRTTAPMTLVRIAWGAAVAVWAITLIPDVDPFLTDGALRYERSTPPGSWNPLEWTSWSGAPLLACLVLVVAALATAAGFHTRLSSVVALLCLIAVQRTNTTILNSGDLFLRQVGLAVALSPCGLLLSLDARRARRRNPGQPAPWRAPWAMRLLQLQLALGYLLSFAGKIRGETWRDASALARALRIEDLQRFALPELIFQLDGLLGMLTWSTLAFEASFLFLVWNRRLRPWVLGVGVAMHLGIDLFLDVGFFSIAIWIAYLTWIFPGAADRIVGRHDPVGVSSGGTDAESVALTVEPAQ